MTPAGGVALDAFKGTGKAAIREGFRFFGCAIDEQYATIACTRIEHEVGNSKTITPNQTSGTCSVPPDLCNSLSTTQQPRNWHRSKSMLIVH